MERSPVGHKWCCTCLPNTHLWTVGGITKELGVAYKTAQRAIDRDAGKYGQMGFRKQENREIRSSGGSGNDSIPSTVARKYDFGESGGYLGNVG